MEVFALREDLGLSRLPKYIKYKHQFRKDNPYFFNDIGTMIFCGKQGSGKTLSAVNYVYNLLEAYPHIIVVTNVELADYPFNCGYRVNSDGVCEVYELDYPDEVVLTGDYHTDDNDLVAGKLDYCCIEYDGLDSLKYINNSSVGVVYLIDELHLELNSLESKNIDIDVIVEISQQRKQRKKIIGTSQVYMRLAKPVREQVFDVVICRNFFKCFQFNKSIDADGAHEENGKLQADVKKRVFWFHDIAMYNRYDTFAKMKRYNKEWKGHSRDPVSYGSVSVSMKKGKGVSFNA